MHLELNGAQMKTPATIKAVTPHILSSEKGRPLWPTLACPSQHLHVQPRQCPSASGDTDMLHLPCAFLILSMQISFLSDVSKMFYLAYMISEGTKPTWGFAWLQMAIIKNIQLWHEGRSLWCLLGLWQVSFSQMFPSFICSKMFLWGWEPREACCSKNKQNYENKSALFEDLLNE